MKEKSEPEVVDGHEAIARVLAKGGQ